MQAIENEELLPTTRYAQIDQHHIPILRPRLALIPHHLTASFAGLSSMKWYGIHPLSFA